MKRVPTPWKRLAKFLLLGFGIPFTLIGIALYIVLDGSWALLLNGILWLMLGMAFLIKGFFEERKLERFEREDLYYEGLVVNILPCHWVRIGSYITVRVECSYNDSRKVNYLVQSGYYLLSPFDRIENLSAKIHINDENPRKHCVELFYKGDDKILSVS